MVVISYIFPDFFIKLLITIGRKSHCLSLFMFTKTNYIRNHGIKYSKGIFNIVRPWQIIAILFFYHIKFSVFGIIQRHGLILIFFPGLALTSHAVHNYNGTFIHPRRIIRTVRMCQMVINQLYFILQTKIHGRYEQVISYYFVNLL